MTPGPGDQGGRLRASHADRDRVICALKTAFVQGRLARHEFDARVGQALTSRTNADLAVITADLPVSPAGDQPAPPPLTVTSGVCVTVTVSLLAAVLWAEAWFAHSAAALAAALALSGVVILTMSVAADQMRELRRRKRSAVPLPPGALPGPG